MNLYKNALYMEDVRKTAALELPWEDFSGTSVVISGATGLIGSFLTDVLAEKKRCGLDVDLFILSRNREKAAARFSGCKDLLRICPCDILRAVPELPSSVRAGYVLHLAGNTHPVAYATDPIGTVTANVIGTKNMLDLAVRYGAKRFAFASSNEIYGENRGDTEFFDESYCGYIDCNTLRAGYPESKRCGEALCQAYIRETGLDAVIPRLTRSYGPTLLPTDTKALSQFLYRALKGEDIVLKSAGTQYYSYTHVADAVSGFLTVLLRGRCGEAVNIADPGSDIMLKDLARILADCAGTQVVFALPDAVEAAGFSRVTKARLDGNRLRALGWRLRFDIRSGLERTYAILKSENF